MKKLLIIFSFFCVMTSFGQDDYFKRIVENDKLTPALDEEKNKKILELTYEPSDKASMIVTLSANEILLIKGLTMPSAGYQWSIVGIDETILSVVAKRFKPIKEIGTTDERIVIKGIAKGTSTFKLLYCRKGVESESLKEYIITVNSEGQYKGAFAYKYEELKSAPLKVEDYMVKALPASFDWRSAANGSIVTSVKNQGNTNACWAFGACGSFEAVVKKATGITRDFSEQALGNCNTYGFGIDIGGWFPQYLFKDKGGVLESQVPLKTANQACGTYTYYEKAASWAYTDGLTDTPRPAYAHNASTTQIKQAIYDHGPIAANCVWDNSFGHIITIVGWDDADQTYIVKNSWGTASGDAGYYYVGYNDWTMGDYSVWVDITGSTTTCNVPTGLTSTTTSTSASLIWTAVTGAAGYNIVYRVKNASTWISATSSTNSYTLTGLTASTTYEWGLQTKCSGTTTSAWTALGPVFTTTGTTADDGGLLTNGVTANGNMDATDASDMWYIDVPENATSMQVVLTCGTSDFDTYGKFNTQPTTTTYDWNGYNNGGENNTIANPQQGRHYIMVAYYAGGGAYTLKATITTGGTTTSGTIGTTRILGGFTNATNRRAAKFVMPQNGTITSISLYHLAGTGSMILGVYGGTSTPGTLLGKTATVTVANTAGWQTVNLTSGVSVASGTTIWLSWVLENNAGTGIIAYAAGSVPRADAGVGYASGMPTTFGTSTLANYDYSIYANYTVNPGGEIPSNLNISLYPNPCSDFLKVNIDGGGKVKIKLISITGVTVYEANVSETLNEIDVSGFSPGLYNLVVISNRELLTKKVIIK